ncbi:MAG: nucleotidyltransferase domain-containing protein [Armatimonadota bacterium]
MDSVEIRSANREAIARAVEEYAAWLRATHPEVERVIWFGSWVTGIPTPRSDVDICLVLSHSDVSVRERRPAYLPTSFPTDIDLLPLTREEFAALEERCPSLYRAVTLGKDV